MAAYITLLLSMQAFVPRYAHYVKGSNTIPNTLITSAMRVGWFFIRYARCNYSKITARFSRNSTHVQHLCRMSLLAFNRSRSKFKVICFVYDPSTVTMTTGKTSMPEVYRVIYAGVSHWMCLDLSRIISYCYDIYACFCCAVQTDRDFHSMGTF